MRGVAQANLELGVLHKIQLTDGVYTRRLSGYSAVTMDAPIQHCGGVAVFYCVAPRFSVKALQQFRPNVVSL